MAFPDVEFVLQGEGITLLLDGKTDIKAGVTYSRFESAPDAPFTVFETVLPAGPHGVLTPNVPEREEYSLCKASLQMPSEITGQNGAILNQTTNIAVTGCAGVKDSKAVSSPEHSCSRKPSRHATRDTATPAADEPPANDNHASGTPPRRQQPRARPTEPATKPATQPVTTDEILSSARCPSGPNVRRDPQTMTTCRALCARAIRL